MAARVDGHAGFLRQNRINEIRKTIRIDTDAILEPLAHAHYRRYIGLGELSHRLWRRLSGPNAGDG